MPEWLTKVFSYAPRVATAIATGGTSELVNVGLSVVGELVTGKPFTDVKEAEAMINNMTPEQLLTLKQADQIFETRKLELEYQDRENTREAVTQNKVYAALFDHVGRKVINENLWYITGIMFVQIAVLVMANRWFPTEAVLIVGIIGNLAGAVINQLSKERSDVIGTLYGAAPNKDPLIKKSEFTTSRSLTEQKDK